MSYYKWVYRRKLLVAWVRWVSQVSKTAAHAAALASAGLVINCAVVHSSAAQIAALPPPEYSLKDENGVRYSFPKLREGLNDHVDVVEALENAGA